MRRRDFITLLGGAGAAWPLAARAQQPDRVRRIGVLYAYPETDQEALAHVAAFREGLQKAGWAEGRNIRIDYRGAPTEEPRQRFAKELVALQPDLILSGGTAATAALLRQTRSIPIIFVNSADPVGSGLVTSLARPGGNVTGFINLEPTMASKWLELLKGIAPRVASIAFLFNPATAPYAEYYLNPFRAAAPSFGVEAITAPVHDASEFETIISAQARKPNGGLVVMPDPFPFVHRAEITSLAIRHRLPAVYSNRGYAEHGGLLSYGADLVDNLRRAASYGDRILRGEKPSDRLPALAAELVRRQVAVIAAFGDSAAVAAKAATTAIPIVFSVGQDPVRLGLVASLAQPGGNVTGINVFATELAAKRLDLLREMVPAATRVAVLVGSSNAATESTVRDTAAAARAMGLQVQVLNADTSREIDAAFATLARERSDALFVDPNPFFVSRRVQLVNLASRLAVPAVYLDRAFAEIGGLMSYGASLTDAYRQVGVYTARILKGTKPADLPVLQSSKFELVINHQTARMLGLTVPPTLIATADEVIE